MCVGTRTTRCGLPGTGVASRPSSGERRASSSHWCGIGGIRNQHRILLQCKACRFPQGCTDWLPSRCHTASEVPCFGRQRRGDSGWEIRGLLVEPRILVQFFCAFRERNWSYIGMKQKVSTHKRHIHYGAATSLFLVTPLG